MSRVTHRTVWPPLGPPPEDGVFLFSNGVRKRARYTGDRIMIEQVPVTPEDPDVAAEAARLNARHQEALDGR